MVDAQASDPITAVTDVDQNGLRWEEESSRMCMRKSKQIPLGIVVLSRMNPKPEVQGFPTPRTIQTFVANRNCNSGPKFGGVDLHEEVAVWWRRQETILISGLEGRGARQKFHSMQPASLRKYRVNEERFEGSNTSVMAA